ncbi:MAG: tRNA (N(6)-L-threonylcarbamoyladenosine(37)-C(2))-methylthiotransferase MtaB [Candidatus Amulumruptor caecigallinarius]|nr:tRNA (N(6)-L-threonylcarbamoyladenosine(37)-C(2))-methylthiotransferase MtaB [Candidatus Amulumruptor caecigallinarius]MCM1396731.1 tRNA (N(6)-L-threonylcarbamoyladenosine(37)-C(2))-methylthiotransferase MtaB [Candidatus Amulumruptor caecigallinarius]MCM1453211.1 tRNA (N(6)-L-threonylcarbamoyladenosine(37)-C(2))-methylthiotransferase MtaB [bacterium]
MINNDTFGTRRVMFRTFGCKLNFAESSSVGRQLAERGFVRAADGEEPDLVVVNTCSVTELADKKCRQAIRGIVRRHPHATVLVTGCYAQLKPKEVSGIEGVDIVIGTNAKSRIAEYLDRWEAEHAPVTEVPPSRELREFVPACSADDRTRHFLKVQDGCDYYCSYCTIPMARGRSRSGTIDKLLAQAQQVAADGGREIVLTGVNIGDFGKGRSDTLLDLIRELDKVEGIDRYRISSIEPDLLSDDIISFVAGSRSFMPHFHTPLQSGSDTVLRLMRRHYDTALFVAKVAAIRSAMPDAFIGVDLITGARGETEEEYQLSRRLVESLDISRLHVFPYSERPGTRALTLDGVVNTADRQRRTAEMLRLSESKVRSFAARFIGTTRPVLLEHRKEGDTDTPLLGFTDNYLRVAVEADDSLAGTIVPVRLTEICGLDEGECLLRGEVAAL